MVCDNDIEPSMDTYVIFQCKAYLISNPISIKKNHWNNRFFFVFYLCRFFILTDFTTYVFTKAEHLSLLTSSVNLILERSKVVRKYIYVNKFPLEICIFQCYFKIVFSFSFKKNSEVQNSGGFVKWQRNLGIYISYVIINRLCPGYARVSYLRKSRN